MASARARTQLDLTAGGTEEKKSEEVTVEEEPAPEEGAEGEEAPAGEDEAPAEGAEEAAPAE